jgi:hypothetical protein
MTGNRTWVREIAQVIRDFTNEPGLEVDDER